MTQPVVSVIVLNYNGAEHLPVCLDSLLAQSYRFVQIIVADNGSEDDSAQVCAEFPAVQFRPLGQNYGFAEGNNLGAESARGDYLFFVNNDMRFAHDCIEMLVNVAESALDIFALDLKQYTWNSAKIAHAATRFCEAGSGGARFLPGIEWVQFDADSITAVPTANGANLFCVADRFRKLGGFDPSFFLHWEDVDLCWRARLHGWEIQYVPQAYCWHKINTSKQRESRLSANFEDLIHFFLERNRYRFAMKTMNSKRNFSLFEEFISRFARHLARGRWAMARLLLRAYWNAVGKFWEVRTYKRLYGNKNDGVRSEDILRKFWLDRQRLSELRAEGRIIG